MLTLSRVLGICCDDSLVCRVPFIRVIVCFRDLHCKFAAVGRPLLERRWLVGILHILCEGCSCGLLAGKGPCCCSCIDGNFTKLINASCDGREKGRSCKSANSDTLSISRQDGGSLSGCTAQGRGQGCTVVLVGTNDRADLAS